MSNNMYIDGKDGKKLYCHVWDDVENPKGVVQIVHGMGEHAGRYAHFAEFLNKNGYIAFGDDHRAHGLTESDETRGHTEGNIFEDTVCDEVIIYNYLKEKYNLPVMMLGHSYGSFLGQAFLEQGTDICGVALTGAGFPSKMQLKIGMAFGKFLMTFNKKLKMGWLEIFTNLRDKFAYHGKDDKGKKLWLTRDPKMRQVSIDDKISGVPMSISFCYYVLAGTKKAESKEGMAKLKQDTPIGIFCGDEDPIGGNGKTATKLKDKYIQRGVKYVDFKLYKGARHEVLNEINRDEVMQDILSFYDYCLNRDKIRRDYENGK